jgi:alpha-tubulin suppressor-like RCC1 family protein
MALGAPAHVPYTAKAWGNNSSGQLGDGTHTGPEKCVFATEEKGCSTVPVAVSGLSGVTALAGSSQDSFALLEGATIAAWGTGHLGNGAYEKSDVPVALKELGGVAAIAAGANSLAAEHSLALLTNGTVVAWGANASGQLGDGTTTNSDVPVGVCAVGATSPCSEESQQLKEVIAIAAGEHHSLALLSNGTVLAWGANESGQLGNGTTTNSDVPVAVKGLSEEVTAIAAGSDHSLALLKGHTGVAWGATPGSSETAAKPTATCPSR